MKAIKKLNVIIIIIVTNLLLFLFQKKNKVMASFNINLLKHNEYFLSNDIKHFHNKSFLSITNIEKKYNIDNSIYFFF